MSNLFPLTPVSLLECLEQMKGLQNLSLCTTDAIAWLIGKHENLPLHEACSLVKEYHIEDRKAFFHLGDTKGASGVYGVSPDNMNYCLFHIIKR